MKLKKRMGGWGGGGEYKNKEKKGYSLHKESIPHKKPKLVAMFGAQGKVWHLIKRLIDSKQNFQTK